MRVSWQNIQLSDTLSWGGEPAANLLIDYIQTEQWDIYTADNANTLIATGRMIPSPQGSCTAETYALIMEYKITKF